MTNVGENEAATGVSENYQIPESTVEANSTGDTGKTPVGDQNLPTGQEDPAKGRANPISLERIRQLRASQQQRSQSSDNQRRSAKPTAGQAHAGSQEGEKESTAGDRKHRKSPRPAPDYVEPTASKVAVPSRRAKLSDDLELELTQALGHAADLDKILIGDAQVQAGRELEEGQRLQAKVLKVHGENVFLSLGGPNEGVVSILQFESPPQPGTPLDVVVRGYLRDEGLYEVTIPGNAISVADWEDLKEGEVVEAKITGANTGGLECVVGSVRGFIPISQIAEYRVEDTSEFIDQKVLCVVTEANPRRGNLVLSRRAVLERERQEKREQRLAALEPGTAVEGVVRKIMDFGAFIDLGGLDGLLHISQLAWERVKHPSEILQEGQKIQVRVEKIDPQTGKISLTYRSLQDHPWKDIDQKFPVGSLAKGVVSRIANFGAFVKLAPGVEGLVHLSELAHYRVQRVTNVVQEGQEIEVKILSVEQEEQRISLSLKAAQQPPASESSEQTAEQAETSEAPVELALPKHRGPLKGGIGRGSGGEQFGLKW